jgi:DNA-binding transcriptional MerR regulator
MPKAKKPVTQTTHEVTEQDRILEREKKALELKKLGYSYRKIGDALDMSHTQARHDIENALAYIKDDVAVDAKALRDLEVARLDDMLLKLQSKINDPHNTHYKAFDTALRIMERRSKLLGLDAPVKVQELTWRDQAIADIKAGTITYDALREAFDDSLASELFARAGVSVSIRQDASSL